MRLALAPISREDEDRRRARCRECAVSVGGKFCGRLFNGNPADRQQEAYLPTRACNANAKCPDGLWGEPAPVRQREPEPIPAEWRREDYGKDSRGTGGCNC